MSDDEPPSEPEFVVITASNPSQAAMYRQLVQARVNAGLYPARVAFRFYSDPPGGRVGSGGGTLLALLALLRDEDGGSTAPLAQRAAAFFAAHRVLLLHAGGLGRVIVAGDDDDAAARLVGGRARHKPLHVIIVNAKRGEEHVLEVRRMPEQVRVQHHRRRRWLAE